MYSIAKEGTDLSEYPDTLPKEKAEFTGAPNETFDFCPGATLGTMKTVIPLKTLADFYPYNANFSQDTQECECTLF